MNTFAYIHENDATELKYGYPDVGLFSPGVIFSVGGLSTYLFITVFRLYPDVSVNL